MQKLEKKSRFLRIKKSTIILFFFFCILFGIFYTKYKNGEFFSDDYSFVDNSPVFLLLPILAGLIVLSLLDMKKIDVYVKNSIFPRFSRDKVGIFENEMRQSIYKTICHSGIRFNQLRRKCGCTSGQLQWHLKKLLRYNLIKVKLMDNHKFYYPTQNSINFQDSEKIILFSPIQIKIVKLLQGESNLPVNSIAKRLHLKINTVRYHIKKLREKGILEAKNNGKVEKLCLNEMILKNDYIIL